MNLLYLLVYTNYTLYNIYCNLKLNKKTPNRVETSVKSIVLNDLSLLQEKKLQQHKNSIHTLLYELMFKKIKFADYPQVKVAVLLAPTNQITARCFTTKYLPQSLTSYF